jgi:hypothetical protein
VKDKKFFVGIYKDLDETKLYTKIKIPAKKNKLSEGNDGTIFMDIFGKTSDLRKIPDVYSVIPVVGNE